MHFPVYEHRLHYRFLVDGQDVKYVSTVPSTFRGEPLSPFPPGSWNRAHAAMNPETGKATFVRTETLELPRMKNIWHPVKLNEVDFTRQDRVRQRVHASTHPEVLGVRPVLVKLAAETAASEWISDSGVGPKFLGHLTEGKDKHVVGFVVEWVEGARTAGLGDMDGCRKALARLHELGIKLSDINKYNPLVRGWHDVVLVDFETAKRDCSPAELEIEMSAWKSSLESTEFPERSKTRS
ncbi:hypothetical protein B0J13DRAFT_666474 [Dactylonectria estremocensis]|uniref:Aminoglycoside phosphotransferase domain-containing protein n=1 Tax=Dactylonectria estremocensis TaxID=1079267 RepID=A0A9P9ERW9_9HYPO|nr:hypothetical protein B0J13DRAFT_666474 [Dactylonectria estremocensis]